MTEDFNGITHANAVRERHAPNGKGLEELRDDLAVGLGVGCSSRRRLLGRGEVGDTLRGLDVDVGKRHGVCELQYEEERDNGDY